MEKKINTNNRTENMNTTSMRGIMLSALLSLIVFPCFCQGLIRMDVREFKEVGDSLRVCYTAKIVVPTVATGQGLCITPVVEAGDSLLLLPHVTVLGNNKRKVIARYRNNAGANGKSFNGNTFNSSSYINKDAEHVYTINVPYRLWMDSAALSIRQETAGYRAHKLVTCYRFPGKVELEDKEAYRPEIQIAFIVPEKEEKRRKRQRQAFLDFQAGCSVIIPTFRRNPAELAKIDRAVSDVVNNPDASLLGLYIEGYASPEGLYATNERLSRERATALKDYLKDKFSLAEETFKVNSVAEDWDGLVEMVRAGGMPQKDRILEIIATVDVFDGREAALMKLDSGVPYRQMLREIFPSLRKVEYRIDYTVRDYCPQEVQSISLIRPEDLSELEFYRLALASKNKEQGAGADKDKAHSHILLELIPKYFPNSASALNNAAAILLKNGELPTAKRYLERAGASPQALNNRGVASLLEGDLDKAEGYLNKAREAGSPQAVHNLEEMRLKREDNKKMERYQNRR